MPRGIPASGRRGKKKSYAKVGGVTKTKLAKPAAKGLRKPKVKGRVSAKNVVLTKFDEVLPQLEGIKNTQALILQALSTQMQLNKAGLMDAWRHYCEGMSQENKVADPAVYLRLFINSAEVLGITVHDLQEALSVAAPVAEGENQPVATPEDETPRYDMNELHQTLCGETAEPFMPAPDMPPLSGDNNAAEDSSQYNLNLL